MIKELKTSQLLEYKKLLKTILDGIEGAISIRSNLIEYDSVTKFEHAKYDSLQDPEPYYHLKLFDKAIGIIRLYSPKEWTNEDLDKKYFHFAIRCYNFNPYKDSSLSVKRTAEYSTYGDFPTIQTALDYFYDFARQLFIQELKVSYSDSLMEIF